MYLKYSQKVNQLNTKIGILEEKLDNMSMASSGKEDLDKEDEFKKDLDKEDKFKKDLDKEDEVKKDVGKENVPKSQIWSNYPRTQRRHTIADYSKSKSGRKN